MVKKKVKAFLALEFANMVEKAGKEGKSDSVILYDSSFRDEVTKIITTEKKSTDVIRKLAALGFNDSKSDTSQEGLT